MMVMMMMMMMKMTTTTMMMMMVLCPKAGSLAFTPPRDEARLYDNQQDAM